MQKLGKLVLLLAISMTSACADDDGGNEGEGEGEGEGEAVCGVDSDGACPGRRVCVDGGCIIPIVDTTPVADDVDVTWDALWADVTRNYALFAVEPFAAWDELYLPMIDVLQAAPSQTHADHEMAKALQRLNDGHVGAFFLSTLCDIDRLGSAFGALGPAGSVSTLGACAVPAGDGVIVTTVDERNPDRTKLEVGDEIVAVDGRDLEQVIGDLAAQPKCFFRASNEAHRRAQLLSLALLRDSGDQTLTVRRDGVLVDVDIAVEEPVACSRPYPAMLDASLQDHGRGIVSGPAPRGAWYMSFDAFGDDNSVEGVRSFNALLEAAVVPANEHSALIIDLRGNSGGDPRVLGALMSWLVTSTSTYLNEAQKEGREPGVVGDSSPLQVSPDADFHVDVPVAVLVDPLGLSAVDFMAEAVAVSGAAILVGAPAAGAFGGAQQGQLGDVITIVNPLLITDVDGVVREGVPTPVNIAAVLDAADVKAGVDTVVEAALDALAIP